MIEPGFWKEKSLKEMTVDEWEALCDCCGRCCLEKLEDEDTGEILYTCVACSLLDIDICRCTDYQNRHTRNPSCKILTPDSLEHYNWMPETCAYRLIMEGKDLPEWHPLISNDSEAIHTAEISVRDVAVPINHIDSDELGEFVIEL
jgi:uncharacterized cysteine cluster protein YcgN (CxxCxxCC family)